MVKHQSSLTALETALVAAVEAGDALDLAGAHPIEAKAMATWGTERSVRAHVIRDILRGRLAPKADPHGLRLRGAVVQGRLDLDSIHSSVNLMLDGCYLPHGITLADSRLMCRLDLRGSHLASEDGPALAAEGSIVDAGVFLTDGCTVTGSGARGAVYLFGARLGRLILDVAELVNDTGPALHADKATFDSRLVISGGSISGAGSLGAIRLAGAHLGGQLELDAVRLVNASGPALVADQATVEDGVFVTRGYIAGAGEGGAIRLHGAQIRGQLALHEVILAQQGGPALNGDRCNIGDHLLIRDGSITGGGGLGTVRFQGTHVRGRMQLIGTQLLNETGPALAAELLQVEGGAILLGSCFIGIERSVNLTGATLRNLVVDEATLKVGSGWVLDGFSGGGAPAGKWSVSLERWLQFLREGTAAYSPAPYQDAAAAAKSAGHDAEARRILISQRWDQLDRGGLTSAGRAWAWLTGKTVGFGYRTSRVALALLASTVLAVTLGLLPAAGGAVLHHGSAGARAARCTPAERAQVAVEVAVPLIFTTAAVHTCTPMRTPEGDIARGVIIVFQLFGWATATLFVAGYTRIIRTV